MKQQVPYLDPQVARPRHLTDDIEMREFFLRFGRSLSKGDPKEIAALWCVPSFVVGDSLNLAMTSTREIERFFRGAKEQYASRGISEANAEIENVQWVTEHIAVVDVRWPYRDRQGEEIGAESSTYTLKSDESGEIKILVALMKGVEGAH